MEESQEHGHLEGRVTGLEREVKHIVQTVDTLATTLSRNMAEMRSMFGELQGRISQDKQMNWPLLVASVVMVVVIGGVGVNYINMRQMPQSQAIDFLITDAIAHESLDGHPAAIAVYGKQEQKLAAADSSIVALKELLLEMEAKQKEWRNDARDRILRLEHPTAFGRFGGSGSGSGSGNHRDK